MGVSAEKHATQLRRAIQTILERGLHDPRVKGIVTVSRLKLSPDYANATVYVTVMPEEHAELTVHGLQAAEGHMRSQVSRKAKVRRVPALHFRLDVKAKKEAVVFSAIADAVREDEARAKEREAREAREGGDVPRETVADPGAGESADEALAAFDAFIDSSKKRDEEASPGAGDAGSGPDGSDTEDRGS